MPHFSYPFIHPQSLRCFCFSIENDAIMNTGIWTSLLALTFNFISSKPRVVRWYVIIVIFVKLSKTIFHGAACLCVLTTVYKGPNFSITSSPSLISTFYGSCCINENKMVSHCHFNCIPLVIHLFTSCCLLLWLKCPDQSILREMGFNLGHGSRLKVILEIKPQWQKLITLHPY